MIFLPDGLDSLILNRFNSAPLQVIQQHARIAQSVEQRIENPRVGGSIPPPGTIKNSDEARLVRVLLFLKPCPPFKDVYSKRLGLPRE